MIKMADKTDKGIYYKTLGEAREAGEFDAWKESRDLNIDCAEAIDSAIFVHNYELHRYNTGAAAADVVGQFGPERVNAVVAAGIRDTLYDGRWSEKNKEWAKEIPALPHKISHLRAHRIVLDGFAKELREQSYLGKGLQALPEEELFKTEINFAARVEELRGSRDENTHEYVYGTNILSEKENYLKNAEMASEDDYGMIDGIINNGPRFPEAEKKGIFENLAEIKKQAYKENGETPKREPGKTKESGDFER
jgi:hypothetical protein